MKALLQTHFILVFLMHSASDCVIFQAVKCPSVCGSLSQRNGPLKLPGKGKCLCFIRDRRILQLPQFVSLCVSIFIPKSLQCWLGPLYFFLTAGKTVFNALPGGKSWEIINKSVSLRGISSPGARYIKLNSVSRLSMYETLKTIQQRTVDLYFLKLTGIYFRI